MTAELWKQGREMAGLTQVDAARALKVSQPYLSQLESGLRMASAGLARKAAKLYRLAPTALPLLENESSELISPDILQEKIALLGYPGFSHLRGRAVCNPAEVVLSAIAQPDLDTRLVEALPWILAKFSDLDWEWLRDRAKLRNAQNRLGYLVHLARQTAGELPELSRWERDLEEARLAREGTLCRESMPTREREWVRSNRSKAATHWSLLTGLTAEQLPYAAN